MIAVQHPFIKNSTAKDKEQLKQLLAEAMAPVEEVVEDVADGEQAVPSLRSVADLAASLTDPSLDRASIVPSASVAVTTPLKELIKDSPPQERNKAIAASGVEVSQSQSMLSTPESLASASDALASSSSQKKRIENGELSVGQQAAASVSKKDSLLDTTAPSSNSSCAPDATPQLVPSIQVTPSKSEGGSGSISGAPCGPPSPEDLRHIDSSTSPSVARSPSTPLPQLRETDVDVPMEEPPAVPLPASPPPADLPDISSMSTSSAMLESDLVEAASKPTQPATATDGRIVPPATATAIPAIIVDRKNREEEKRVLRQQRCVSSIIKTFEQVQCYLLFYSICTVLLLYQQYTRIYSIYFQLAYHLTQDTEAPADANSSPSKRSSVPLMNAKTSVQVHFSSPHQPLLSNTFIGEKETRARATSGDRLQKSQPQPAVARARSRRDSDSESALACDLFDELLEQVLRDDSHELSVGGIIFASIKEFMDESSTDRDRAASEPPASPTAPAAASVDEADQTGGAPAKVWHTSTCTCRAYEYL